MKKIHRALLSVYDKTGIIDFARVLADRGIELVSTGGTFAALKEAGLPVVSVEEVTGFPEMLDGRVKTLHPAVHGGILARRDIAEHISALNAHGIKPIDLVVINLYPFEDTVASGASFEDCIEKIDIGGPSMLRSSAKNHEDVTVLCDVSDYALVLDEINEHGGTSAETRTRLAAKVFHVTASYDAAIATYLDTARQTSDTPETLSIAVNRVLPLRYGENPHQPAALYGDFFDTFEQFHGKELSYNNIVDIEAAVLLVEEFERPAAAIIKHTNPCGCALGDDLIEAYQRALTTDPVSAFGGIIAFNREVTAELAELLNTMFSEVVIAPSFTPAALGLLQKKRDRRLICQKARLTAERRLQLKSLQNGYLVQMADTSADHPAEWKVATLRPPTAEEYAALEFAWKVAKHVKSNAIVYTNATTTLGVGAGQMSRIDSSAIAVMKASNASLSLSGSVVASDAFFPFADGLLEAVNAGATAVIQPGGSVRDAEVIEAANAHGIAMIFTGIRHFKH